MLHLTSVLKMSANCAISKINPREYKKMSNFKITYGIAETKFGKLLMGLHEDNICFLTFLADSSMEYLQKNFPKAQFVHNDELIQAHAEHLFDDTGENYKLLLKGTEFQTRVWEELVNLRRGSTCSYADLAKAIGNPKAVRAVANAVAKNNIAYLVPCHRVINKDGSLGKYGCGPERKLQLLRFEKAM